MPRRSALCRGTSSIAEVVARGDVLPASTSRTPTIGKPTLMSALARPALTIMARVAAPEASCIVAKAMPSACHS
jgi:hypothetical protein